MNNEPIWRFPTTFVGGGIGFNDGGTQIFKDNSIQSLAREVCQNSIDARKDNNKPVEVEFSTFKIKNTDFPGYSDFLNIIQKEVSYCDSFYKNNKDAINYYQEALRTLEASDILVLRISDFNTTGLTVNGNSINNNWSNLVVYSGTNDKNPEDGGSFGLGKNAMYSCSKFGTLFFSTHNIENVKQSECVAKLSYFYDDNDNIIHGLGFYGNYENSRSQEGDKPIKELCNLDKNFTKRESETGTDIYILGFELPNSSSLREEYSLNVFKYKIASAIIDSYFISILEDKLIVKVNDLVINKDNLYDIFDDIYTKQPDIFNNNTVDYLEIMRESEIFPICIMNKDIPDAELRLQLNPKYHNRIAMIRNTGMKIFDKGNFPQIAIFSGILILRDKMVNGYFKKMENPAHDNWILARIKEDKTAKNSYDNMLEQIRNIIKRLAQENIPENMDIVGLSEYLPDDWEDESQNNKSENINDDLLEDVEVKERIQLSLDNNTDKEGSDEGIDLGAELDEDGEFEISGGHTSNKTDGGNASHGNGKPGSGKNFITKDSVLKVVKKRGYYDDGAKNYKLYINPQEDLNNCVVGISLSGEEKSYPVEIVEASISKGIFEKKLEVKGNSIKLGKVLKNEKILIQYSLKDADNCTLEVSVYEN